MGITFDWTINVGNLITIGVFLLGGVWYVFSFVVTVGLLKREIEYLSEKVTVLREEVENLGKILVTLGQHDVKFSNVADRFERIERDIADFRRGEGLIVTPRKG